MFSEIFAFPFLLVHKESVLIFSFQSHNLLISIDIDFVCTLFFLFYIIHFLGVGDDVHSDHISPNFIHHWHEGCCDVEFLIGLPWQLERHFLRIDSVLQKLLVTFTHLDSLHCSILFTQSEYDVASPSAIRSSTKYPVQTSFFIQHFFFSKNHILYPFFKLSSSSICRQATSFRAFKIIISLKQILFVNIY